jgi:hypothetical protein
VNASSSRGLIAHRLTLVDRLPSGGCSRRPGRGTRILAGLACAAAVAACGGSSASTVTTLGCNQYCQQAGVPQGLAPPPSRAVSILTTGLVRVLPHGLVPIKVACHSSRPCSGALVFGLTNAEIPGLRDDIQAGQSDLAVGADQSRTIGVPLLAPVQRLLRSRGELPMLVFLETGHDLSVAARTSIVVTSSGAH